MNQRISEVDTLVAKFEKDGQNYVNPSTGMIKRRKLEVDILASIERLRDIMNIIVQGDKRELDMIFGGSCVRIGKTFYLIEVIEEKLKYVGGETCQLSCVGTERNYFS